jgi:phage shock protein PspC (stress-responsive transcriptional regulator)
MDVTLANVLVVVTFGLLLAVTGGVAYITTSEWRDRRRRDRDGQR